LDKVRLTKLIRKAADLSLNEAHELVDRLVNGEAIAVIVPSDKDAHDLAESACELGAKVERGETEIPARR
jgi:ribosomal protein L7/L12